jgi:uncharacterized protein (TIGR02001 family)
VTLLQRGHFDDFYRRTLGSTAAGQAKVAQGPKAEAVKEAGFPMWGKTIKATIIGAGALALMAGSAIAADAPVYTKAPPPAPATSPFDVSFGGVVATDYNFRGISQSNRGPSAGAYLEGQYNGTFGQFYLGVAGYSISWPGTAAFGFTDPAAEIDFFGGWRKEFGNASVDIGAIYYYYPKEIFNGFTTDSDFFEIYWKGGYSVSDKLSVGANVFYTPDLLNYSETFATGGVSAKARGLYTSVTAGYTYWEQGDWSAEISGELGHWWIKKDGFVHPLTGLTDPSYTYWNAGLAFAYKALTLDLRYHGNDLGNTGCGSFLVVGTPHASNKWCGDAFIASLKFDTSLSALK